VQEYQGMFEMFSICSKIFIEMPEELFYFLFGFIHHHFTMLTVSKIFHPYLCILYDLCFIRHILNV